MSKKLGLHIGGRRFDVDVADDFAPYLLKDMAKDFKIDGNNDLKLVLQAYIRKTHDLFVLEQRMKKMIDELE